MTVGNRRDPLPKLGITNDVLLPITLPFRLTVLQHINDKLAYTMKYLARQGGVVIAET